MPYQSVSSHLEAVLIADLHNFINSVEVDMRNIGFLIAVRNVLASVLGFADCDESCGAAKKRVGLHLVLKCDAVVLLF